MNLIPFNSFHERKLFVPSFVLDRIFKLVYRPQVVMGQVHFLLCRAIYEKVRENCSNFGNTVNYHYDNRFFPGDFRVNFVDTLRLLIKFFIIINTHSLKSILGHDFCFSISLYNSFQSQTMRTLCVFRKHQFFIFEVGSRIGPCTVLERWSELYIQRRFRSRDFVKYRSIQKMLATCSRYVTSFQKSANTGGLISEPRCATVNYHYQTMQK